MLCVRTLRRLVSSEELRTDTSIFRRPREIQDDVVQVAARGKYASYTRVQNAGHLVRAARENHIFSSNITIRTS